jgi:gamma-glutamyltranspeptidase/glutathione hydrolase
VPPARRFAQACVASAHHLASGAGLEVLATGGNALDAAVAANLTMGVVAPYLCGYGGDVFALVWRDGQAEGYLGAGAAPGAATVDAVRAVAGADRLPTRGALTVTVPGAVRGWFDLLERYGTRSFGDLAARALGYARDGVPLSAAGGVAFQFLEAEFSAFDEWRSVYGGSAPGAKLLQPGLARTIETLAEDGPDAYYRGPIAAAIVECVAGHGGLIADADLAAHRGEWVAPLAAPYRDVEVLELPPPTQGVTALEALRIVDRAGPLPTDPADRHHRLVEAVKLAFADRDAHVSDPAAMTVAPADLLADDWVDARVARLDPARALPSDDLAALAGGTSYFCAADDDGLLVSLIQTNFKEFGSGLTVPGWGINLQNRGTSFSLDPGHVNCVAPGKRTLHTLIPAMALRDGRPWLVFGTMSGDTQFQVHLQLLTQIVDDDRDIQEAIDAPRWRFEPGAGVRAETRFDPSLLDGLRARGHDVSTTGAYDPMMGHAHAITVERHGYAGASDPRSEGAALGF